jgi:CRISPR/Cas system-associated exonuclease Cas4 (RecB family)
VARLIRASEVGEYVFCHRAWWLHMVEGLETENQERLGAGTRRHRRHGLRVAAARILFISGLIALATGVIILLRGI